MRRMQSMTIAVFAAFAGVSSASGCNTWTDLMAACQGEPCTLIDETLANGDYFGIFVHPVQQVVLIQVGEQVFPFTGWSSSELVSLATGLQVACDGSGRVGFSVVDDGGFLNRFDVYPDGTVLIGGAAAAVKFNGLLHDGDVEFCPIALDSLPQGSSDVVSATDLCHGPMVTTTAYISSGNWQDGDGDERWLWFGTVESPTGVVHAGGVVTFVWGQYWLEPFALFADQEIGQAVNQRLIAQPPEPPSLPGCPTCVGIRCIGFDSIASMEYDTYIIARTACGESKIASILLTFAPCWGFSIPTCAQPLTVKYCFGALACEAYVIVDAAYFLWNYAIIEDERMMDCLCNATNWRLQGLNPAPCTYSCPPRLTLPFSF